MNIPSHEYCKECKDWNGSISNCMEICGIPMDIIKEWEKYHAIGTPEECRVAVEKQTAKKPNYDDYHRAGYRCPTCNNVNPWGYKHCKHCGQKLDWSDENDKK